VTSLRAGRSGVRIPVRPIFCSPKLLNQPSGPHSLLFNGYGGSFQEVNTPGRNTNSSPSSIAKVKNKRSYTSISPYTPSWCGQRQLYILLHQNWMRSPLFLLPTGTGGSFPNGKVDAWPWHDHRQTHRDIRPLFYYTKAASTQRYARSHKDLWNSGTTACALSTGYPQHCMMVSYQLHNPAALPTGKMCPVRNGSEIQWDPELV